MTRLPYVDDESCIRHRLDLGSQPWPTYDVHDLGLACDHGATCAAKRGAA
jgi:hypothetical protein